jgi:AP-3 complex subunit delta-1
VLYAAAWVTGEFAEHLDDPLPVLDMLLQPSVATLPGHIQGVYVHNALKLYAATARKTPPNEQTLAQMRTTILDKLVVFVHSGDLEVQERAVAVREIIQCVFFGLTLPTLLNSFVCAGMCKRSAKPT